MDVLTFALFGLGTGAINALLGCGLVLIYRGTGVINFSQGALAMVGAFTLYEMADAQGLPQYVALALAIVIPAVICLIIQLAIMRPLRTASPLVRVIATLGVLTIITQLALLKFIAPRTVTIPVPNESVTWGSITFGEQNLYLAGIAILVGAGLGAVSSYTRVGRAVQASAENARAAAALGWSPNLLACLTWASGGAIGGLAGALFPATSSGFVSVDQMTGLIIGALATALLAEFRRFSLAVAGGLAIGIAQSIATRFITTTGVTESIPFLFIVLVLVVRGRGLPVRGTLTDRLPRVGTGRIRVLPVLGLGLAAIVVARFALPDSWYAPFIVSTTFAIVGLSVVVLSGYAGQLSLAQFALGGVGAYAAGRLASAQGWPMPAALLAGVVAAIVVGFVFGLPALRTRGVNLAIITFGLGFAVYQIVFANGALTGGDAQTVIKDPTFLGIHMDPIAHPHNFLVLNIVFFVLVAVAVANLRRGRAGRRLLAVRTNERAAASIGVDVYQAKLYAFVLSAAIAGLGGALYGFSFPTIPYAQSYAPDLSITIIMLAVIGGIGHVLGPLAASGLAPEGVGTLIFSDANTTHSGFAILLPLITGIMLLLILLTSQNGLVDQWTTSLRRLADRYLSKRTSPAPAPVREATAHKRVPAKQLEAHGITMRFGGFTALSDVSVTVRPGEVLGLLGPNGAGKTTLIDVLTGYTSPSAGRISFDSADITRRRAHLRARAGITRSFQSLELFDDLTVRENLMSADDSQELKRYVTDLVAPGKPHMGDTVAAAIKELELDDILDIRPEDLPYGRRRLVAIARAIAARPSVLLLDEPAAGLDEEQTAEVGHLIRRLADEWGMAVLLIEHDVSMVLRTADRVQVLDFGQTIAEGTPEEIRNDPAVRAAYLGQPMSEMLGADHVAARAAAPVGLKNPGPATG